MEEFNCKEFSYQSNGSESNGMGRLWYLIIMFLDFINFFKKMSGLNPEKHELLEIAVLITDGNLNILEEVVFIFEIFYMFY